MSRDRFRLPTTRRSLLLGGGAFVVLQATGCDASPKRRTSSGAVRQAVDDDSTHVQALVDAGDTLLPSRRYLLSRPIVVPGGRKVMIQADAVFHYTGEEGGGVFRVAGDHVTIEAQGGGAIVSSSRPRLDLWAVEAISPRQLRIVGIAAQDCGHVHIGAGRAGYGDVIVAGSGANVASDIAIIGGGARYAQPPEAGNGACWIEYATDWRVEDAVYDHVPHGVEWWGGNAAFDADGQPGAERKCQRFHVKNVTVRDATLGGIWGAMGQDGVVEGCTVQRCGDVGLDAEGCRNVRFTNCTASDARNGSLATFFSSDGILFEGCAVTSSRPDWPLFRSYNASQNPESGGNVKIQSCTFFCIDESRPSTVDTRSGPLNYLKIENCIFKNVTIDTGFNNMHFVTIANNVFTFTTPGVTAVKVGSSRMIGTKNGGSLIKDNRIIFKKEGGAAIAVVEDDYNSVATSVVTNNTVTGPVKTGILLKNNSGNAGIRPQYTIERNDLTGAHVVAAVEMAKGSTAPQLIWKENRLRGAVVPKPKVH